MLLKCEDLCAGYEANVVFEDLRFEIDEGDYVCVMGENGAGKSTLVKVLLGHLRPNSGKISFRDGFSSKKIGYLPQQKSVKRDFPASVWEVVLSGNSGDLGILPFYKREHKIRAEENMKRLGIFDLRGKSFRCLSGGQQQPVLLARALCATRELLVLDEPQSSLDPIATEELYSTVEKLNKDEKITVLMVSHDVSCARRFANKILHLSFCEQNPAPVEKPPFLRFGPGIRKFRNRKNVSYELQKFNGLKYAWVFF